MLPKAHLTSYSRLSDSGWVITPLWLCGSWRSFLYRSSVYSCHHFLISFASVRSTTFLSFTEHFFIFEWKVLLISNFLKEIFSLSHPIFSSISLHSSLKKPFLSLLAILQNSAFKWVYISFPPLPFLSLLFRAFFQASTDNHFAFLHFFFMGMILITASCTMSWTSIHISSGTLTIRSNPLDVFVTSTV